MSKTKGNYSAFDTATYYLSFKDRTVKELTDKLKDKGYEAEEIDDAVSKLLHYGYLDDERYARAYIKDNLKRKGINLIKRELFAKGVDRDAVSSVWEPLCTDTDSELMTVRGIYSRRFLNLDMSDDRQKRRVYSYFQRRGFSFELVNRAIRDMGEE
jgi:regulatory protein